MSQKSPSKEYEKQMRLEDDLNKKDSERRWRDSIRQFDKELKKQATKGNPPNEKKYIKSILTSKSPGSTKKGGKRRKPRKTKKHRKKKSL